SSESSTVSSSGSHTAIAMPPMVATSAPPPNIPTPTQPSIWPGCSMTSMRSRGTTTVVPSALPATVTEASSEPSTLPTIWILPSLRCCALDPAGALWPGCSTSVAFWLQADANTATATKRAASTTSVGLRMFGVGAEGVDSRVCCSVSYCGCFSRPRKGVRAGEWLCHTLRGDPLRGRTHDEEDVMNPIRRVVAYIRRVNEPREPASFDEFVERYAVPGNHFGIHRPGSEAIG